MTCFLRHLVEKITAFHVNIVCAQIEQRNGEIVVGAGEIIRIRFFHRQPRELYFRFLVVHYAESGGASLIAKLGKAADQVGYLAENTGAEVHVFVIYSNDRKITAGLLCKTGGHYIVL